MLTLPIKKKWFDMILSGEKKEEYREMSDYYWIRLMPYNCLTRTGNEAWKRPTFDVQFRNGYKKDSPSFIAECTVNIGTGRPEWGAEMGKKYYVLHILQIIEVSDGAIYQGHKPRDTEKRGC